MNMNEQREHLKQELLKLQEEQDKRKAKEDNLMVDFNTAIADENRPHSLHGVTHKVGNTYTTINELNGSPFEVFIYSAGANGDVMVVQEALAKVISLFLRTRGPISPEVKLAMVADELRSIGASTGTKKIIPCSISESMTEYGKRFG